MATSSALKKARTRIKQLENEIARRERWGAAGQQHLDRVVAAERDRMGREIARLEGIVRSQETTIARMASIASDFEEQAWRHGGIRPPDEVMRQREQNIRAQGELERLQVRVPQLEKQIADLKKILAS